MSADIFVFDTEQASNLAEHVLAVVLDTAEGGTGEGEGELSLAGPWSTKHSTFASAHESAL